MKNSKRPDQHSPLQIANDYAHEEDTRLGILSREVIHLRTALREISELEPRPSDEGGVVARRALED